MLAALASSTAAAAELAALFELGRPLTDTEIVRAADLIDRAGGRAWAQSETVRHVTEALSQLRRADPVPVAAAELAGLARMIVGRDS